MEKPEGPWAWVVLAAVMLTHGLTLGFPSAIGVFFRDLQSSFEATNTETAWFPSIIMATLNAGGPLCSIMVEKFGCRVAVMVGGLLCGIGMVASSFSQSIVHMYLSAGIVGGFLADITGQYSYVFYFCSIAVTSSGLFMLVTSCIVDRKETGTGKDKCDHKNIIYQPQTRGSSKSNHALIEDKTTSTFHKETLLTAV